MNSNLTQGRARMVVALAGTVACAIASAALAETGATTDPYSSLPPSITLNGVCRDFRWASQSGGHADFEYVPTSGYAHYVGIVQDLLDVDGKPVFAGAGRKVSVQAKDAAGRQRMPIAKAYLQARSGDTNGTVAASTGGAVHDAARLAQWYRDVAGVNVSKSIPMTLVRQPNTNMYTFNDKTDPTYSALGGFFPINGALYGNSPSQGKNFGFTYELSTMFTFKRGTGQVFTFTGDDDVWVFVNGKLVVDIGGVHGAANQTIDLDRMLELVDGQDYPLTLFFAERHTTQSNVRIDTTITLKALEPPATTALYD